MKSKIEETIYSNLVEGTKESILAVLEFASLNASDQSAMDALLSSCNHYMINEVGKDNFLTPLSIVPKEKGLAYYMTNYILATLSSAKDTDSRKTVFDEIIYFVSEYEDSAGKIISENQLRNLLSRIDEFGLTDGIIFNKYNRPLGFSIIPYMHSSNSTYSPALHIMGCHKVRDDVNPEFIVLHELGHVYRFCLSGDMESLKVPKSFMLPLRLAFSEEVQEAEPESLAELFADSFSIALAFENEYTEKVPFCSVMHKMHQEMLYRYFKMLVHEPGLADSMDFWKNEERVMEIKNILRKYGETNG